MMLQAFIYKHGDKLQWLFAFIALSSMLSMAISVLGQKSPAVVVEAVVLAGVFFAYLMYLFLDNYYLNRGWAETIAGLERDAKKEEQLLPSLSKWTEAAVKRERAAMEVAQRRANGLFFAGSLLIWLAVLCPVAAAYVYMTAPVVPEELLTTLKAMQEAGIEPPKDLNVVMGKDWHVLASGVAFGLLCLTAAKSILAQHTKQSRSFLGLNSRVNRFERLRMVLDIKAQFPDKTEAEKELMDLVLNRLLATTPEDLEVENEPDPEKDEEPADAVMKALKDLRGGG